MLNLKVYNSKRYKEYCIPTGNIEIDELTEELYNSYAQNGSPESYIVEILCNYFTDIGYKILYSGCYTILEREDKSKWLIIRNCQNYVFEINKIEDITFDEIKDRPELVCDNDNDNTKKTDWVNYLYRNHYPITDILTLLDIIGIKIHKTPKDQLGNLNELS